MIILSLSELSHFMEIKTASEMSVEPNQGHEKLIINFDVTLHSFPCSIVSIDVMDIMGSHSVNVHGTITKNKLNKEGKVIGQEVYKKAKLDKDEVTNRLGNDEEMPQLSLIQQEMNDNEGCQIYGYFYVNKVPGNFHISAHAYGNLVQQLVALGYTKFNISHTINHLSFGDKVDLSIIKQSFNDGQLNVLDKSTKKHPMLMMYEYYLNVR